MFNVLLPLLGVGLLVLGALAFWAAIQNWIATLLDQASERLGRPTHTAQSALVILDRIMVNGQRVFAATIRAAFTENSADQSTQEPVTVEEVKTIARTDLPADVLARLEAGETLEYAMSVGTFSLPKIQAKKKDDPTTYRLAVRRTE